MDELKKYFPTTLALFDGRIRPNPAPSASQLILAICVGRETNALEILPCAFYLLCRSQAKDLFTDTGYARLSREDLKVCVLARESLRETHRRHAPEIQPFPECKTRASCGAAFGALAEGYRQLGLRRPMSVLSVVNFDTLDGLCNTCAAHAQPVYDATRQEA